MYFREDDDHFAPFSNPKVKKVVVPFLIVWNYSYGILYMVVFLCPDAIDQHLEQTLLTLLDVTESGYRT